MPPVKKESLINNFMEPELIQIHQTLISDVASINAQYLGIAVTILIVLGGAHYLLNIKPLKQKIERQERKIEKAQNLIDEQSVSVDKATKKVEFLSQKLQDDIEKTVESIKDEIATYRSSDFRYHVATAKVSFGNSAALIPLGNAIDTLSERGLESEIPAYLDMLRDLLLEMKESNEKIGGDVKKDWEERLEGMSLEDSSAQEKIRESLSLLNNLSER